jgi:hypothetical protein
MVCVFLLPFFFLSLFIPNAYFLRIFPLYPHVFGGPYLFGGLYLF